jgi:hypothetical protein
VVLVKCCDLPECEGTPVWTPPPAESLIRKLWAKGQFELDPIHGPGIVEDGVGRSLVGFFTDDELALVERLGLS